MPKAAIDIDEVDIAFPYYKVSGKIAKMKTKDNNATKNINNLKKALCPRCGEISCFKWWVLDKYYWKILININ